MVLKISKQDIERIVYLYLKDRLSKRKIGKIFGFSETVVRRILLEQNIKNNVRKDYLNSNPIFKKKDQERMRQTQKNSVLAKKIIISPKILEELYLNQKLSTIQISKMLKVSKGIIVRRLKEMSLKSRNLSEARRRFYNKDAPILEEKIIIDMYTKENKATHEICSLFNCTLPTINKILRKNHIPVKPFRIILDPSKIYNEYWNLKKNTINLSEQYGCSPSYIKNFMKRNKIKLRTRKEIRSTIVIPKEDTKIEVKIQNYLQQLGIEYFTHQYMHIEHGYQCDILIPSMNLVIECDGDYWHKYPIGREIDHIRTSELLQKGFKVLRLWEHEIKAIDLNKFKEKLDELD